VKVGDLVRMKNDGGDLDRPEPLGMIIGKNTDASVSWGICWYVFYFAYNRSIAAWEKELELLNEGR